jgi:8-oxo-dGTP pyrophosphatase MutT (NUDIX family)
MLWSRAMDAPFEHSADPFSEAGFRALAREGLLAAPSQAIFDPRTGRALGPGDWDLNPEFMDDLAVMAPPRPAAVLVPIVLRAALTVMLTQRSHEMPSHPGQISFPGGKMEECDQTPVDCALREAREEVGLPAEFVETLGFLDSYRTGTGFQISPVVAFVRPGFVVALDPREVLEVFEVPLAFLMDEANHQKHTREWRGRQRSFYAMPYEGRYIWGATAGMLKNMHQRLLQR